MHPIVVPDICIPLLKEQRTHYLKNPALEYSDELNVTFEGFERYLPAGGKVLDIGCGMAGIDVLLAHHYKNQSKITIADKQGVSSEINCGYHEKAEAFSNYHDFKAALKLLEINGVNNVECIDLNFQKLPEGKFDIVISLLSWGFHYPIDTYHPNLNIGGIIISDVRKNTKGIEQLSKYGKVEIIKTSKKYERVVVQC